MREREGPLGRLGGFTLIELLVVMAIISLLSSIVLTSVGQVRSKARDSKRVQDLIQVRNALEQYALDNQGLYPPDPVRTFPLSTRGESCWDCVTTNVEYDSNRLEALSSYLNPRPADPFGPFTGGGIAGARGYWYKVSESRKHYKIAILGSVEDLDNVPTTMSDPNFYSGLKSISLSSDDLSEDWVVAEFVSCTVLLDC